MTLPFELDSSGKGKRGFMCDFFFFFFKLRIHSFDSHQNRKNAFSCSLFSFWPKCRQFHFGWPYLDIIFSFFVIPEMEFLEIAASALMAECN